MINLISPEHWDEYELIDSGGSEKLERYGKYILRRPEPQALWDKALPEEQWESEAQASFLKDLHNQEKGQWQVKTGMQDPWFIQYRYKELSLKLKLSLSSFKHVGLFPEQAVNWDYIYYKVKNMRIEQPKVLNLFAYTGAASVAAKLAGADVTHVDSVKPVISWARENMELSEAKDIRWVVEDALKFVQREARRGNKYHGLILDPPAYGRGPAGEKWLLEEHINEMLRSCAELLEPENNFFLINLYSIGFSHLILQNLVEQHFGEKRNAEYGELFLQDKRGYKLPLGIYGRFG